MKTFEHQHHFIEVLGAVNDFEKFLYVVVRQLHGTESISSRRVGKGARSSFDAWAKSCTPRGQQGRLCAAYERGPNTIAAVIRINISLTCSSAPITSPVWPPTCWMHSRAINSAATSSRTKATAAVRGPKAAARAITPRRAAIEPFSQDTPA